MGVSFVARKCTQCAGRLQYIKEKKLWKCLYCGAEIERQEQYDGLFTIKNVVRQCLLDTAFRRLDSAAKNLVECEKIDSRYVGTLIAKITHEMISVITPGACSERDVRNLFAQLKKNYELLRGISPTVTEEEEVLYEFLEEPDIFATLVLVYDSLNDSARRDYVLQMLDAKQVYSKDANGNLLTYALKNGRQDLADDVLSNTNNINVSMALSEVLQKYPDGDKKREHIADLIKTHALAHEDCAVIEKYLTSPCDSIDTKATVINAAVANGMDVSLEFVVRNILPVAGNENTLSILDAYCSKKLVDDDVFRMMIGGRQCICDVPLIPDPIAAVLRLSVNGISRDAEGFFLLYERHIVAAGSVSCGHGRHHLMRAGVAGINAMVFIDERLVSMLLRPQGTGHILRALHNASALVIQTQDGWHTVSAGRALQRRCQFLAIPNAPSRGTGSCRECGGYKGLLFHSRLRIQSTRNIM